MTLYDTVDVYSGVCSKRAGMKYVSGDYAPVAGSLVQAIARAVANAQS